METGHYHLQIVISVVMIVGAAVVALICDFLKRNNEQLREMNIELKIRHEEERRRLEAFPIQPAPAPISAPVAAIVPPLAANQAAEKVEKENAGRRPQESRSRSMASPRSMATPGSMASPRSMATPVEAKRALAPEALAAMERGARLAAGGSRAKTSVVANPPQPAIPPAPQPASATVTASKVESVPAPSALPAAKPAANKRDWNSLLARGAAGKTMADGIPAGYHDGYVLGQLVQSRQPVTGLVVSIGVSAPRDADGSFPEVVRKFVQSLIGADDFACQSSSEEFLLVYPKERGASAQRRLNQIAQQLWDFQLNSMNSSSILFSWGGLEVRSESIDEAIASANDRMHETRRGRKLLTMEPRPGETPLREAV